MHIFQRIRNWLRLKPVLNVSTDSGGTHKPTIIFLHGIAATAKTWDPLLHYIDPEVYRVITIDLLGFGDSPKPMDCTYTVEDHIDALRRTLKSLRIKGSVKLVGHSMGSIIAARYCRMYPNSVQALYLLSPPIYVRDDVSRRNILTYQTDMYLSFYQFLMKNREFTLTASRYIRKLLRIKDGVEVTEATWQSFRLSLLNTIIHQRTRQDIKAITVPIFIMYGANDEFLITKNITRIASQQHNVHATKLAVTGHGITSRFARKAAECILGATL